MLMVLLMDIQASQRDRGPRELVMCFTYQTALLLVPVQYAHLGTSSDEVVLRFFRSAALS